MLIFKYFLRLLLLLLEWKFKVSKLRLLKLLFYFLFEFNKLLFNFKVDVSLFELVFWFNYVLSIFCSLIWPSDQSNRVFTMNAQIWLNWVSSRTKTTLTVNFRSCQWTFKISLSSPVLRIRAYVWTIWLFSLFKRFLFRLFAFMNLLLRLWRTSIWTLAVVLQCVEKFLWKTSKLLLMRLHTCISCVLLSLINLSRAQTRLINIFVIIINSSLLLRKSAVTATARVLVLLWLFLVVVLTLFALSSWPRFLAWRVSG